MKILDRYTGAVLFEGDAGMTVRDTLKKATAAKADLRWADLRGADLRGADLRGANLRWADLRGADLRGADLRGANLRGADLGEADLRGANLGEADLYKTDLRWANLGEADLREANLYGADLRGADLRGADLGKHGKLVGNRPYFCIGPIGSRSDYLQAFLTDIDIHIRAGCFAGTLDEFRAAVAQTHGDTNHAREYEMAMLMIEAHAAIWMPAQGDGK